MSTEAPSTESMARYAAACEQARRCLAAGRPDEALLACATGLRAVPEGWEVHLLLGEAHAANGSPDQAHPAFELVLRFEPGCAPAARGLARAVAALEGSDAAAPFWRRAADLREYWGEEDTATANGPLAPAFRRLTRAGLAHRYARAALWEHAVVQARACLVAEPGRSDLMVVLIRALWRAHQVDEAAAALAALRGRQPLALPANLLAALMATTQGGDVEQPLAMARRVDPLLRAASRVLDAGELAWLVPEQGTGLLSSHEPAPARGWAMPAVSADGAPADEERWPHATVHAGRVSGASCRAADEPHGADSAHQAAATPLSQDGPGDLTSAEYVAADGKDGARGPGGPVPTPGLSALRTTAPASGLALATARSGRPSNDVAEHPTDQPGTIEEWRTLGDERRRHGDYTGAIAAYAEALALLRGQ